MPTVLVEIDSDMSLAGAVIEIRRMSEKMGSDQGRAAMLATAASELGRNMLRYAGGGQLTAAELEERGRRGMEIVATDAGPGIEDVEAAMQDHFSTGGTLGLGLPGVKRMVDDFVL